MISLSGTVSTILTLIVAGVVFWLLWWLIGYCGIPDPFNRVARVILAVLAVLVCIGLLLSLVGGQPLFRAKAKPFPALAVRGTQLAVSRTADNGRG